LHKGVDTRLNRKRQNYKGHDLYDVDLCDYFSSSGRLLGGKKQGQPFSLDFYI